MIAEAGSVPAAEGKAYRELGQIVRERGWLEKAPDRLLIELGVHLALHLGGIALFLAVDNLGVRAAALLLVTYGGLGIVTNTHTSSHNATSRSMARNRALTYFGYTFLFGTAAHYWWNKHCVIHHPAPNVIEVDGAADYVLRQTATTVNFRTGFFGRLACSGVDY